MQLPQYAIRKLSKYLFKFYSVGPKGTFELHVRLDRITGGVFNLAFGLWDPKCRLLNDRLDLRNGDIDKILATVGIIALEFLEENPSYYLFARGSTPGRTRKYQMGIARYLHELKVNLKIWGFPIDGEYTSLAIDDFSGKKEWNEFTSGTNYAAFLISRK
ncbi:DUF6934 family protein [Dyadobacter sp.]|uniref:DUF6934 family protein n=1 Tax=Dyadobacter sp. TaxID=1914288 RepID=UPI003F6E8465